MGTLPSSNLSPKQQAAAPETAYIDRSGQPKGDANEVWHAQAPHQEVDCDKDARHGHVQYLGFVQAAARPARRPYPSSDAPGLTVTPSDTVTFKTKRGRRDNPDAITKQSI